MAMSTDEPKKAVPIIGSTCARPSSFTMIMRSATMRRSSSEYFPVVMAKCANRLRFRLVIGTSEEVDTNRKLALVMGKSTEKTKMMMARKG